MDLCREIVWDTPNDGTQYAKLEEADRVYDFLAGLNHKFDIVCGRIFGHIPLHSLMEVCFEVRLEEDCTNAMGVLTTPTIDSAVFSVQSSNHDSDKNNGKSIRNGPPTRNRTQDVPTLVRLPTRTSQSTGPTASQTKTPTLGAIAQFGMSQSLGLICVDGKNPGILDLGATDHLTANNTVPAHVMVGSTSYYGCNGSPLRAVRNFFTFWCGAASSFISYTDTEIFFKKMIKRLVPRVFNSFMSESNRKEYKKKKQGKSKRKTE
ncbi:UBN2_3 domain-containing protein [Cucumis melo var. makuwa]|uniref:UBN2_3 domain-containing protein n=1 Tax=Cucumis melo var. makuwa TaxID=1194695 RepID=A0A5D3C458_CUCMM|nr:UBN2_3 domain-containing protein [Cucumis melo var. makuwa]